jgi:hypothetical protein
MIVDSDHCGQVRLWRKKKLAWKEMDVAEIQSILTDAVMNLAVGSHTKELLTFKVKVQ